MTNARLIAAFLAASGAASAFAADWPQWRGPNRDGYAVTETKLPDKLPANLPVVWKSPIGFGLDSPVVAGGKVFFLAEKDGKEVVHAVAADGKPIWSAELDETFKDGQSDAGPRCTAVVDGDLLYAQSCRGTLRCLAVADGKEVWATNFTKDFEATFTGEKGKAEGHTRHGNTGAPVVDGDHLIAGVGGKEATYVCFDKKTGKVVWKTALENLLPAYAAPIVASPAGVKQVIAFTTGGVVGIDRESGKALWTVAQKTALGRHVTTPTVAGDMIVVGSFNIGLVGIKLSKSDTGVKAEQIWQTKDAMPNFSSPVLVGGTHVIGVGQGLKVFCAEVATGKIAWSADATLGKAHAGLIVVGDKVLALGDNGELVMFAADVNAYRELGRSQVAGKNWCTPAYVDGKLFLRDAKELKCLEIK
ncbi:outer membrane protein assembly factor BamB family protein [Humisphaera borealis]|uniref:PQQ-binding-like beta-propeller repeat protein n=1 Tax=Humisphaera borealis TaxID=2807512 RepID=A0A7M2X4E0_9BACT|nr:PQQ-binding-like beta-propeller repeat protein [Humisphaera borealis]QOV91630.1 PQQ-binding-like beta-propeller repeat protein [Humisphaera borealis]